MQEAKLNGRITRARAAKFGINVTETCLEPNKRKRNSLDGNPPSKRKKIIDAAKLWPHDAIPTSQKNIVEETESKSLTKTPFEEKSVEPLVKDEVKEAAIPKIFGPIVKIEFRIGEVVWAKIKGFVAWPGRIKSFPSNKMVIVTWLNDYRATKIYRTQMYKFLVYFDTFSNRFHDTVGLETAAREGLILFGQNLYNGS